MSNIYRTIICVVGMIILGMGAVVAIDVIDSTLHAFDFREGKKFEGVVLRVLSGDSVEVMTNDGWITYVKLWGTIAPAPCSPYGKESREHLETLLITPDAHNRVIFTSINGYYLVNRKGDNLSLNREQIDKGFCWVSSDYIECSQEEFQNDKVLELDLLVLENEARRALKGLWKILERKTSENKRVLQLRNEMGSLLLLG